MQHDTPLPPGHLPHAAAVHLGRVPGAAVAGADGAGGDVMASRPAAWAFIGMAGHTWGGSEIDHKYPYAPTVWRDQFYVLGFPFAAIIGPLAVPLVFVALQFPD